MNKKKITLPGIVLSSEEVEGIIKEDRVQIVKSEQYLKYIGKLIFIVCDGKAYGTIKLSIPKARNLSQFKKEFKNHKISTEERKKRWPKKKHLYTYNIELIEGFDSPIELEIEGKTKVFIKSASYLLDLECLEIETEIEEAEEEIEEEEEQEEKPIGKSRTLILSEQYKESVEPLKEVVERKRFIDTTDPFASNPNATRLDDFLDVNLSEEEVLAIISEQKGDEIQYKEPAREEPEEVINQGSVKITGGTLQDRVSQFRAIAKSNKNKGSNNKSSPVQKPKPKQKQKVDPRNALGNFSSLFKKSLERL